MEKSIFEQMDGTYNKQGDYFPLNLAVRKARNCPLAFGLSGIYGTSENTIGAFMLVCS